VSMDATIRSNVSVGLPVDLALIRSGDLRVSHRLRLDAGTPLYTEIRDAWASKLAAAVRELPRFEWEMQATAPLQRAPGEIGAGAAAAAATEQ